MKLKIGFTLLEVLVVVIIITILASLTIPGFNKTKQAALDKEAKVSLKLIQAAQKNYFLKMEKYYPDSPPVGVSSVNSELGLNLSAVNWNYGVVSADSSSFSATANRSATAYFWKITQSDDEAVKS